MPLWALYTQLGATIVIAIAAAFIGYRQWRTAHDKLVLDLFDRRLAIYTEVVESLGIALWNGDPAVGAVGIRRARVARNGARFLFAAEIVNTIEDAIDQADKLRLCRVRLQHRTADDEHRLTEQAIELEKWLERFLKELYRDVMPFLSMLHRR